MLFRSSPFAPAGWYPDPSGEHASRYWDGSAWTDHVSENPPPASVSAAASGSAGSTSGGVVLKFVAFLIGLLNASSLTTVAMAAAFGPRESDYVSQVAYDAALARAANGAQFVGLLVVLAVVAALAPRVGYRNRDVLFMLIPVYSAVFLVRLLWRVAHLPRVYWSVRT